MPKHLGPGEAESGNSDLFAAKTRQGTLEVDANIAMRPRSGTFNPKRSICKPDLVEDRLAAIEPHLGSCVTEETRSISATRVTLGSLHPVRTGQARHFAIRSRSSRAVTQSDYFVQDFSGDCLAFENPKVGPRTSGRSPMPGSRWRPSWKVMESTMDTRCLRPIRFAKKSSSDENAP
jgi:hypothetical protein